MQKRRWNGIRTRWLDLARQWRELTAKAQELKKATKAEGQGQESAKLAEREQTEKPYDAAD